MKREEVIDQGFAATDRVELQTTSLLHQPSIHQDEHRQSISRHRRRPQAGALGRTPTPHSRSSPLRVDNMEDTL